MEGQIIKIVSNLYYVEINGKIIPCHSRGLFRNKNITPVVGDYCIIDEENKYIMEIKERRNSLIRPLVSNVDQGLIITSLEVPSFSTNLLDKLITIMEIEKVKPIICVTKEDLISDEEKKKYREIFSYYKSLGYEVYYNYELDKIKKIFKDKVTVFTGQTGSGKSSLFNKLSPSLNFAVGEVSTALGRGKHTTRYVELVNLLGGKLVDTPGFSSIDLSIYNKEQIKSSFIEFRDCNCKWNDCMHIKEDSNTCEVKKKLEEKEIKESRYEDYVKFINEIGEKKKR